MRQPQVEPQPRQRGLSRPQRREARAIPLALRGEKRLVQVERRIHEALGHGNMRLVRLVIASGAGVLEDEYEQVFFPGDDLLAACRARGLPIGSLTSQFWSNCYLHPFDQFVTRELGCRAYLRYVDDFALFADTSARCGRGSGRSSTGSPGSG